MRLLQRFFTNCFFRSFSFSFSLFFSRSRTFPHLFHNLSSDETRLLFCDQITPWCTEETGSLKWSPRAVEPCCVVLFLLHRVRRRLRWYLRIISFLIQWIISFVFSRNTGTNTLWLNAVAALLPLCFSISSCFKSKQKIPLESSEWKMKIRVICELKK